MITLNFNNQSITTEAKSLKDLLAEKSMAEKSGIAVAVNQIIIQKTNLHNFKDKLAILLTD